MRERGRAFWNVLEVILHADSSDKSKFVWFFRKARNWEKKAWNSKDWFLQFRDWFPHFCVCLASSSFFAYCFISFWTNENLLKAFLSLIFHKKYSFSVFLISLSRTHCLYFADERCISSDSFLLNLILFSHFYSLERIFFFFHSCALFIPFKCYWQANTKNEKRVWPRFWGVIKWEKIRKGECGKCAKREKKDERTRKLSSILF